MKSVYTIQNFIKMFYLESNIPAYLYENNNLIYTAPKQTALTYPPQKYLENLTDCSEHISYCSTDYGVYYGCVHIDCGSNLILVLGPVNNIPYSDTELHGMYMDYVVPADEQKRFRKFLQNSPQIPLHSLLTKLIFINYCLNEEMLSPNDFLPHDLRAGSGSTKTSTLVEETFQQKEDYFHNKSYELEELVLNYVQTGNLEGLQTVSVNDSDIHAGITGPTALRQIKNNLIISTTLVTRAAIDGGLDYDTAYKLSDDFIQTAEKLILRIYVRFCNSEFSLRQLSNLPRSCYTEPISVCPFQSWGRLIFFRKGFIYEAYQKYRSAPCGGDPLHYAVSLLRSVRAAMAVAYSHPYTSDSWR